MPIIAMEPNKLRIVLDVLYDLDKPEQILRSLIYQIIKETNINKRWISEVESCVESTEKADKEFKYFI